MKKRQEQKTDSLRGCVHLVGAGPGDPELITVRGRRLIENCGALVYDALVNAEMLNWARPDCRCIFVGKQPGQRCATQESIGDLLVALASEGLEVVRLKGGDPFVFGRGGEEAQRLQAAGVPFTVVPAVTAALAAGAFAGIPLTHREHSSAVTFVSGHEDPRKGESTINWEVLARSGSTLCLYMAVGRLGAIAQRLQAAGLPGSTPACAVQWAGTSRQKSVVGTLGNLSFRVAAAGLSSPAIIVIGEVVSLQQTLSWFSPENGADHAQDHLPPLELPLADC
jgi:uroporphyrinogen III methyltransferase / synthase